MFECGSRHMVAPTAHRVPSFNTASFSDATTQKHYRLLTPCTAQMAPSVVSSPVSAQKLVKLNSESSNDMVKDQVQVDQKKFYDRRRVKKIESDS